MNRTRAADNVAVIPAPSGSAHAPGYFDDGTTVDHEHMNMVQEAIIRPLEDGGVVLDTDNYDQFATLLGGVHAIASNIRSDLETTGVTTVATQGAVACANTICSGGRSFAGGGSDNINSGINSASIGGLNSINSGHHSASIGGQSQVNSAFNTASVGGGGCHNTKASSCSIGASDAYNGGVCSVAIGGLFYENIDDNCVFGGYAAAAPANHGDGLTNKNITWKLHNDTGNAEFEGDVTVTGDVDVTGDVITTGYLNVKNEVVASASIADITSTAAEYTATAATTVDDVPLQRINLLIKNTDLSDHNIQQGATIYVNIAGIAATKTLVSALAVVALADTAAQEKSVWSCCNAKDGAGAEVIAVTYVGQPDVTIGSGSTTTILLQLRLFYVDYT